MPDGRGGYGSDKRSKILAACEKFWPEYQDDCSGFVKKVAGELGVSLSGQANDIYEQIQSAPWMLIGRGPRAGQHATVAGVSAAHDGLLVVGASRGSENGHVVIIVDYSKAKQRAIGYWGKLGEVGEVYEKISQAFSGQQIIFAAHPIS